MSDDKPRLPAALKRSVEDLSGLPMDGVRVHRNLDEAAQLQTHACARGGEIHLGPGQERHLPHEVWHVAQQHQGRARPTTKTGGLAVHEDGLLEREADAMAARASESSPRNEAPRARSRKAEL